MLSRTVLFGLMSLEPSDLFSRFHLAGRASVLAAVSGGGDSLALLFLLKSFLDVHAPHTRLTAVTVDHRLRPEAADEAQSVARLCGLYGVSHRIVAWSGDKPRSGVIAAARDARHRLLAEAAVEAGSDIVMTGHTLDDQAETVAMRRERQEEGEGLSGVAAAALYDGKVWFCRPLLGLRRATLREWLIRRGIAWIDDPSNDNPMFERVRVRAALGNGDMEALVGLADEAGRKRVALTGAAAGLVDEFVSCPVAGLFRVAPRMVLLPGTDPLRATGKVPPPLTPPHKGEGGGDVSESSSPLWGGVRGGGATAAGAVDGEASATFHRDAIVLALRVLLATAGGTPHLPDRRRVQVLAERLGGIPLRATLSRAVVDARPGGIWIRREVRNLPTVAIQREAICWDGRWRLAAQGGADGLVAAPIGRAASPQTTEQHSAVPPSLVRAAFSAEPGVFDGDRFVGHVSAPEAGALGIVATRLVAPHATYLPSFDLALAAALRRLVGLEPLPAAPWKDHIAAGA